MKLYSTLILVCVFQFIILDGARVAINEKFIDAVLKNFEPELIQMAKGTKIEDQGDIDNLEFSIPNFELNKIKIAFTNEGLLNIVINNLSPRLEGTVHYRIIFKCKNNFDISLRNFYFNANLRITSKYDQGKLVPDVQFVGDPDINFTIKLDIDGFGGNIVASILELAGNFGKKFIMPVIKRQMRNMLDKVISGLPKEIPIGKYNLDVTLSKPITLRNKFLEITSNARLFNPTIDQTKTQYFRNVDFPYLTSLGSQLQVYVSEYSVNAAIYTLLMSNNRELKTTVPATVLDSLLPGFSEKYKNTTPQIVLIGDPNASIEITEQSMNVNLPGVFMVKVPGQTSPVFNSTLAISLKVEVSIANGQKASAKIHDLSAKITKVTTNTVCESNTQIIENGFAVIKDTLISLLNGFIKNYMEIPFPTFLGISFTQLTLQHKSHYLEINFNLVRGIITRRRRRRRNRRSSIFKSSNQ